MSEERERVFVIAPAGMLEHCLVTLRLPQHVRTRIRNTIINEGIAARDLLEVNFAQNTVRPRGEPVELSRYMDCREDTDRVLREAGISPERLRAINLSQEDFEEHHNG